MPLLAAIASGNSVLKPSEKTPNAANLLKYGLNLFEPQDVVVFEGGEGRYSSFKEKV